MDPSVTDLACQGLNNMELGDRKLVVQRASVGARQGLDMPMGMPMPFMPMVVRDDDATNVLQLMNMVTPEELEDDEEYQGRSWFMRVLNTWFTLTFFVVEIWEDVAEECSKFGKIVDMKIPRPQAGQKVPGLGRVSVLRVAPLNRVHFW